MVKSYFSFPVQACARCGQGGLPTIGGCCRDCVPARYRGEVSAETVTALVGILDRIAAGDQLGVLLGEELVP